MNDHIPSWADRHRGASPGHDPHDTFTQHRLPSGARAVYRRDRPHGVYATDGSYYYVETFVDLAEAMGVIRSMPDHRSQLREAHDYFAAHQHDGVPRASARATK